MRSGPKPSLSAEAVREVRRIAQERKESGATSGHPWLKQAARRLGCSPDAIRNAVRGESYRWVE